ncbi:MAG: YceI family protein [Saprospiraceae bacterium]
MAKVNFLGMVAAIMFLSAFTIGSSMSWNIEEDYAIKFSNKKASGIFTKFTGDIEFERTNLSASKFDVQIEVASIKTGNFLKNSHAKGKKWFNAKEYPTINFTSEKFNKTTTGYEVIGTLEMRGVKKEMTLPFTFEDKVFKSSFTVNRTDFNIGSTKGMAKKVPHEIQLDIAIPVSK